MIPEKKRLSLESKDFFRKPFDQKIQWPETAKMFALEQLADESAKLLEYAGKPASYWDLGSVMDQARAVA